MFKDKSTKEVANTFYDQMQNVFSEAIPKIKIKPKKYHPWFNSNLIKLNNEKNGLLSLKRNFPNDKYIAKKYELKRQNFNKEKRISLKNYHESLEMKFRGNPKKCCRLHKIKRGQ